MGVNVRSEAGLVMAEVLKRMHSMIAYVAAVHDNQQDVIMLAWSAGAMTACDMAEKPIDYHVSKMGLWGEALRQKKILSTNDYATSSHPAKRGYPKGHVEIRRHLNGPVMQDGKVIAIIGVGNSGTNYTADDEKKLAAFLDEVAGKMLVLRDAVFTK